VGLAGLNEFVSELKRRRVFRALAGWGIFCFAILQVVEPVLHAYHLPEWSLTAVVAGFAPYTLFRLGEPVRGLALLQEAATTNEAMNFNLIGGPYGKAVRALPEFPEFLRRTGLAALWDRHGPGGGCRRIAPGDHRCD